VILRDFIRLPWGGIGRLIKTDPLDVIGAEEKFDYTIHAGLLLFHPAASIRISQSMSPFYRNQMRIIHGQRDFY